MEQVSESLQSDMAQTSNTTHMRLDQYDIGDYSCGAPLWKQVLWYFVGYPIVRSYFLPFSALKVWVLRLFGASIGSGVRIKTGVRVKFPWRLSIGDHSWIGEDCWLDSNATIDIGPQVCLSQGVYLCTGNHDWTKTSFKLRCQPITVQRGSWICAQAKISPGVVVGENTILTLGSVAQGDLERDYIYAGHPAQKVKRRQFK